MRMTDKEVIREMQSNSKLNLARRVFSGELGRLEQAETQRVPPTPIERRRMEFEAVKKIATELGTLL